MEKKIISSITNDLKHLIVRFYNSEHHVVGTGFLVGDSNVLTCAHVVISALSLDSPPATAPNQFVSLDFPLSSPNKMYKGKVIFWKPFKKGIGDVACLKIIRTTPDINKKKAKIIIPKEYWGHTFRAFGFPKGYPTGEWTSGTILDQNSIGWVQIRGEEGYRIQSGFSGGLIWDDQAEGIVGMIVASDEGRPNAKMAFMIPSKILLQTVPILFNFAKIISLERKSARTSQHDLRISVEELREKIERLRPPEERILNSLNNVIYELSRPMCDLVKISLLLKQVVNRLEAIRSDFTDNAYELLEKVTLVYTGFDS